MRDPTEQPIVDGLRRGEPAAFGAAYDRLRSRIFGFLLRLSRRRDVAEELSQETWLRLARSAPKLAEDTDLAAWLFTVARNLWVSYRRWNFLDLSRLVALDDVPTWSESDTTSDWSTQQSMDETVDARRQLARLEQALGAIPAASREVLLLIGVEGFDHDQAAAIVGCKPVALRQRLLRARERLAHELAQISSNGHTAKEP